MSVMKTILVISYDGEDPDEIAMRYAAEKEDTPWILMECQDAGKKKRKHANELAKLLESDTLNGFLTESQREQMKKTYHKIKKMKDEEYIEYVLSQDQRAWRDEETNRIFTTRNHLEQYRYPKCFQDKLEKTGYEAEFSNPFHLKTGFIKYRAHLDEIDWKREHGYGKSVYEAAWEICVEGREPKNEQEEKIKERMMNRLNYFLRFESKKDYVTYSTSFFTYGVATSEKFIYNGWAVDEMQYIKHFYKDIIKPLEGNPLLSIYEVRSL